MEIGLDRDGRRWTLVAFAEDLEAELTPLKSDDTWIVSGGGSGVTAAVLFLALEEVGCSKLALYDGSWAEWGLMESGNENG